MITCRHFIRINCANKVEAAKLRPCFRELDWDFFFFSLSCFVSNCLIPRRPQKLQFQGTPSRFKGQFIHHKENHSDCENSCIMVPIALKGISEVRENNPNDVTWLTFIINWLQGSRGSMLLRWSVRLFMSKEPGDFTGNAKTCFRHNLHRAQATRGRISPICYNRRKKLAGNGEVKTAAKNLTK